MSEQRINAYAQGLGLTGVAMVSVDEDWYALGLKVIDRRSDQN